MVRTHLKNRFLVQDRGGAEFSRFAGLPAGSNPLCGSKTAGLLLYVEDFKRGTNPAKGGRPKDIFEMSSSIVQ
jgi:hypothetical protein